MAADEVRRRVPEEVGRCEGVTLGPEGFLRVSFRGKEALFDPVAGSFIGESLPPMKERILILHYLSRVTDRPLSGRTMSFRNMPEGRFYWVPFRSRAVLPLIRAFGRGLSGLQEVMRASGGQRAEGGDFAFRFRVLPKVEFTYVC